MLEIILAAVGAVLCLSYIFSSAAQEQDLPEKEMTAGTYDDARSNAA